jgi:TonB family protein
METQQRIQAETRRDAEEMKPILFVRCAVMTVLTASCVAIINSAIAQTTDVPSVIKTAKDLHASGLYTPRPEYPNNLRGRIGGSGTFLLHLRHDGTVEAIETVKSTGHAELDDVAKGAFIKWRFRPGPKEAIVPITFKSPRTAGWPFAR